jgi:CheY-like chemotaxis protein
MKNEYVYPQVIIVDDEEYILDFMKSDLEGQGLDVVSFESPNEAIEYLIEKSKDDENPHSLVKKGFFLITDYRMPDMSGLDMIEKLRSESVNLVYAILLSGLIPTNDLDRVKKVEDIEIMEKPVDLDIIIEKIKSVEELGQEKVKNANLEVSS